MITRQQALLYMLLVFTTLPVKATEVRKINYCDLLGQWTVVREMDAPSATNLERPENINPLGKRIAYKRKSVSVNKTEYKVTQYTEREISAEDFIGEFGFDSKILFPGAQSLHWTKVELFNKGRDGIEGADVFYIDDKKLVLNWHGIYFLAIRAKSKPSVLSH